MAHVYDRLNAALAHRWAGVSLLVLLGAAYAIAYVQHPLFPGTGADALSRGWWTWSDQQRYVAAAAALAQGRLDAATLHYPIGYPALGALFWRLWPAHTFFVPDLLLVLAAAAAWWRLATRWLSRVETLIVGLAFVATHRWLMAYTQIVPWNTLLTQAALLAGMMLLVARRGPRALWLLAGLAAATYLARPIDALAFAPLLVWATFGLNGWRARFGHGGGAALLVAAAVLGAGWINLHVFGQWRSPYEVASAQTIGFFSYPVSFKAYWLGIDGTTLFAETDAALLWRYPWLALALPGLVFWIRRDGGAAAAGAAGWVVNWLLYFNYNDLLPSDIYRFTLIHYLAWGFPLLFLLAAAACRHGWRDRWVRGAFVAALVLVVGCAGLRLEEQRLALQPHPEGGWRLPVERPLLVRLPHVPMAHAADLRVDGRALVEYSEFVGPYVPSELQVLLSHRVRGERLDLAPGSAAAGAAPEFSRYRWHWSRPGERLGRIGRGQ